MVSVGEFGVVSSSLDDGVAGLLASTKMLLVQLFFCHRTHDNDIQTCQSHP
jgi:hypothetical protein